MWFDHNVSASDDLSREELISLARTRAERIVEQDARIMELTAANEVLAVRLARVEHLLSRNSSWPPSKDDDPGLTSPAVKTKRDTAAGTRGKQRGAPGSYLAWSDAPDQQRDRFPEGRCGCDAELDGALDLGVVDRYQQVEVPLMTATLTQYDQHAVRCGCGKVHTATRPEGAGAGLVGYGPNLQAWAVYLMVVHFIPVQRHADQQWVSTHHHCPALLHRINPRRGLTEHDFTVIESWLMQAR